MSIHINAFDTIIPTFYQRRAEKLAANERVVDVADLLKQEIKEITDLGQELSGHLFGYIDDCITERNQDNGCGLNELNSVGPIVINNQVYQVRHGSFFKIDDMQTKEIEEFSLRKDDEVYRNSVEVQFDKNSKKIIELNYLDTESKNSLTYYSDEADALGNKPRMHVAVHEGKVREETCLDANSLNQDLVEPRGKHVPDKNRNKLIQYYGGKVEEEPRFQFAKEVEAVTGSEPISDSELDSSLDRFKLRDEQSPIRNSKDPRIATTAHLLNRVYANGVDQANRLLPEWLLGRGDNNDLENFHAFFGLENFKDHIDCKTAALMLDNSELSAFEKGTYKLGLGFDKGNFDVFIQGVKEWSHDPGFQGTTVEVFRKVFYDIAIDWNKDLNSILSDETSLKNFHQKLGLEALLGACPFSKNVREYLLRISQEPGIIREASGLFDSRFSSLEDFLNHESNTILD